MRIECTYLRQEKKRGRASEKYPKKIKKRKHRDLIPAMAHDDYPSKAADPLAMDFEIFSLNTDAAHHRKQCIIADIRDILQDLNIPLNVAEDLLDFYFGEVLFPPTNIFSILRPSMVLSGRRKMSKTLLLTVLLTSILHIDHYYFGESTRGETSKAMFRIIQNRLPTNHELFTYDDMISNIHIGYIMPWIGYPTDILPWWPPTCYAMKRLYRITQTADEEMKEEERRTWLAVYLFDRLISFTFNKSQLMADEEFNEIIVPCDEMFWRLSDVCPEPAEGDQKRTTFRNYHGFAPGIYGWFLPLAKVLGLVFSHQRDSNNVEILRQINGLLDMNNSHLQSAERRVAGKVGVPGSKLERYKTDLLYAKFTALSIGFMKQFIVDHAGDTYTIISNFDSDIHINEYMILVRAVEELEELSKLDSELRRYPYCLSIFVFAVGYAVFLILNNMEREDAANTKKINRLKYLVNVLVRTIEVVLVPFPAVFLRTLRNMLVRSLQDCEKLILLTDHFSQFKINAEQRKEALSTFNWLPETGHGLAP